MRNLSFLLMAFFSIGIFSCSTDSEIEQPQLTVNFVTSQTPLNLQSYALKDEALKQSSSGSVVFSEGFITIRELEFEVETDNDSTSVDFNLEQEVVIDFATGSTNPPIRYATIPSGTFEAVEVEIELQDNTDSPAVRLHGVYIAPDATEHPLTFEFNSGETFEVEREGTVTFSEAQTALAQVTFAPAQWFAGVSDEAMLAATKNAEGVIVISSTQNPEIFDTVADGLDLATEIEIQN
ncbi:hypothetical protein V6B16_06135 [Salinimicrobium catena]|uniref:hypothetical protein n=1 Tax=Salinimicrobium catena TaxID=390640 RepID=UPI002FE44EB5